jgi:hypothetical protein
VMCVHVSVLVSVYIFRVHCPLHHTLDTFYGLFAKKYERILQNFLSVYILTLVQIKLQEKKIEMKTGCNDDAYGEYET